MFAVTPNAVVAIGIVSIGGVVVVVVAVEGEDEGEIDSEVEGKVEGEGKSEVEGEIECKGGMTDKVEFFRIFLLLL